MCVMVVVFLSIQPVQCQLCEHVLLNCGSIFLAGRVPRRKNFAASFPVSAACPVKQGFCDVETYSQMGKTPKPLLNFCRAVQIKATFQAVGDGR
jgi:hypothetical protein